MTETSVPTPNERDRPAGAQKAPNWRTGWDGRLFGLWALYNALAYALLLVVGEAWVALEFDVIHDPGFSPNTLSLLIGAGVAALLFGVVLGSLQWRVIRERIDLDRRRWIVGCTIPAFFAWLAVGIPTVVHASESGGDVHAAYVFAASQTLALGPLLGVGQAVALRGFTRRWAWWIPANVLSWLIVDALVYLGAVLFDWPNFAKGDGSTVQVLLMLLATTPITGRFLLWVLAPAALTDRSKVG